jgi:hypothetical protein
MGFKGKNKREILEELPSDVKTDEKGRIKGKLIPFEYISSGEKRPI